MICSAVATHLGCDPGLIHLREVAGLDRYGSPLTTYLVDGWTQPLTLKMDQHSGNSNQLFWHMGSILRQPATLSLLHNRGKFPVPSVICALEHDPSLRCDWILTTRLAGNPATRQNFSPEAYSNLLRNTGKFLKDLHAITSSHFGFSGPSTTMDLQTSWPDAFCHLWNLMIDQLESSQVYGPEEARSLKRLMETFRHALSTLENASLLHAGLHLEKVLSQSDGQLTGVLGWGNALWGDPRLDLVIASMNGLTAKEFHDAYGHAGNERHQSTPDIALYSLLEMQKRLFIDAVTHTDGVSVRNYKNRIFRLAQQLFN